MASSKNVSLLRKLLVDADNIATLASGNEFPVPLSPIAKRRRVTQVDFSPLLVDAMLTTHSEGFRILLNPNEADPEKLKSFYQSEGSGKLLPTRLRFSLAHELAHTFFYDFAEGRPEVVKAFRPGGGRTALENLEKYCNTIAAHLLLPTPMVKTWFLKHQSFSPQKLLEFATEAGVSIEALIHRLSEMTSVFLDTSFYGCIILLKRGTDGIKIAAMARPRNMSIARELGLMRVGKDWSLSDHGGSKIDLEDLDSAGVVNLTVKTEHSSVGKDYRVFVSPINSHGDFRTLLVTFQQK